MTMRQLSALRYAILVGGGLAIGAGTPALAYEHTYADVTLQVTKFYCLPPDYIGCTPELGSVIDSYEPTFTSEAIISSTAVYADASYSIVTKEYNVGPPFPLFFEKTWHVRTFVEGYFDDDNEAHASVLGEYTSPLDWVNKPSLIFSIEKGEVAALQIALFADLVRTSKSLYSTAEIFMSLYFPQDSRWENRYFNFVNSPISTPYDQGIVFEEIFDASENPITINFYLQKIHVQSTSVGVPEPGTWAMLLAGLGLVGARLRYRVRPSVSAAMAAGAV